MDDSPLLEVEHDVCQLVGVLQYLIGSQTVLEERGGEREREREREEGIKGWGCW